MLHLNPIVLTLEMHWYHWWHHWHEMPVLVLMVSHGQKIHFALYFDHPDWMYAMVSLMMPWASCKAHAKGITWPESHVAYKFDCFDVRNVVHLIKLSASHDAKAGANGVTWPKESCCTSFWSSWPKECNGASGDASAYGLMGWKGQTSTDGVTWPKELCYFSFWRS